MSEQGCKLEIMESYLRTWGRRGPHYDDPHEEQNLLPNHYQMNFNKSLKGTWV